MRLAVVACNLRFRTGRIQIAEVAEPSLQPRCLLVRTAYSAVSPGTERAALRLSRASLLETARERPDLVRRVIDLSRLGDFDGARLLSHLRQAELIEPVAEEATEEGAEAMEPEAEAETEAEGEGEGEMAEEMEPAPPANPNILLDILIQHDSPDMKP